MRHGYEPEWRIQTGIGALEVRRPKVRDGAVGRPAGKNIHFNSGILPCRARRSKSLDALLSVLNLRGISTGNFQEALTALLGTDAPNFSPNVISRLTEEWQEEYDLRAGDADQTGRGAEQGHSRSHCVPRRVQAALHAGARALDQRRS